MVIKFCLLFSLAAGFCLVAGSLDEKQNTASEWVAFKLEHRKVYENRIEDLLRQKLFMANKQMIDKFNANESEMAGYRMCLNRMSDWTEVELQRLLGFNMRGHQVVKNTRAGEEYLAKLLAGAKSKPLPESVDWRQVEGRVTPVKDQSSCGSCWAFSTTGLLEGQQLKVTGRKNLTALSEQNLVDCAIRDGCKGNFPTQALYFIFLEGGIDDGHSYPYNASRQNDCAFNESNVVMTNRGPITLPKDEEALKAVVAEYGPVSVAIQVDMDFNWYHSGVYSSKYCNGPALNHAVLVVGYGTDPKQGDYWIVVST